MNWLHSWMKLERWSNSWSRRGKISPMSIWLSSTWANRPPISGERYVCRRSGARREARDRHNRRPRTSTRLKSVHRRAPAAMPTSSHKNTKSSMSNSSSSEEKSAQSSAVRRISPSRSSVSKQLRFAGPNYNQRTIHCQSFSRQSSYSARQRRYSNSSRRSIRKLQACIASLEGKLRIVVCTQQPWGHQYKIRVAPPKPASRSHSLLVVAALISAFKRTSRAIGRQIRRMRHIASMTATKKIFKPSCASILPTPPIRTRSKI